MGVWGPELCEDPATSDPLRSVAGHPESFLVHYLIQADPVHLHRYGRQNLALNVELYIQRGYLVGVRKAVIRASVAVVEAEGLTNNVALGAVEANRNPRVFDRRRALQRSMPYQSADLRSSRVLYSIWTYNVDWVASSFELQQEVP